MNTFNYIKSTAADRNWKFATALILLLAVSAGSIALKRNASNLDIKPKNDISVKK